MHDQALMIPRKRTAAPRVAREIEAEEVSWSCEHGDHELAITARGPAKGKAEAMLSGAAEFILLGEGPVILLCYRFGEAAPWSTVALEPRSRAHADEPRNRDGVPEERALLHAQVIDERGERLARRCVTLSLEFTRQLAELIRERDQSLIHPSEWKRAREKLRRRYPTVETMVARPLARCIGSA